MPFSADLTALADDFWTWRASAQPLAGDDIPRLERPPGWTPDWSADAVAERRRQLQYFEATWDGLGRATANASRADHVDYRLMGSALARVRWELDIQQGWRRNPNFYVHQALGGIFEALLGLTPFTTERTNDLLLRAESIPATLAAARENLADEAIAAFARLAIDALGDVRGQLETVARELESFLAPEAVARLSSAFTRGADELEQFAEWLSGRVASMPTQTAIGRAAYVHFLRHVALVPLSPEAIAASGQQELDRAVAFEALEQQRNRHLPPMPLPTTVQEQIEHEAAGEQQLRQFCEEHDLLSFPSWLKRYRNAPLPAYLAPLRWLGVTDDLTSRSRLDQDGISYIPEPRPDLPYFYLAMARDPRTLIAHEGVHYYQLARSWAEARPVRQHYYDSGSNEGIGFYAEEMFLQAGLFDDSPRSREIIYNMMRLRAVRVAVDVRLALGELDIDAAAAELAVRVPMDIGTAREEASFFASEPGQAITYQVGKLQILRFLADARASQGASFELRAFHDALWINGNVPIALQRWEALGYDDEINLLDTKTNVLTL
ncbi:MAG TPA: DUF885 family protein [Chloroflexota bacterium]|nr:DUF885 family protein [Chloroflexota bacterium]